MANKTAPAPVWGNSFNTLAQSETNTAIIIVGGGSEMSSDKVLKGRGKRKIISQTMALSLLDIAKRKEAPDRIKTYWNTYHCQNRLVSHDGKLYGKYCKNRCCTLCSSIRKAEIINRYYPVMKDWQKPYFVTLTIKACKADRLKVMLKAMIRAFKRICSKYRKQNQRGKGIRLIGVKSLECCFNPIMHTYNPHFHLIVASEEIAKTLVSEWLALWTRKFAIRRAQDFQEVRDTELALVEIIKYGSKIFTEPDVNDKANSAGSVNIHTAALYNIFEAMKDLRIFERFGFDVPKNNKKERAGARVVTEYAKWVYFAKYHDWLNTENELTLSGYMPTPELVNLLAYNIDIKLE